ncbi:MAG: phage regulatory CII family protein [Nitrososphaerota archaeon]
MRNTSKKEYEGVRRALFQLPRKYSGQMKELADAAGIAYDRLRRATSDVESTREGRDISLIEVMRLMEAADDYSVLYTVCAELGFDTPRKMESQHEVKGGCSVLLEKTLALTSALGVLSATIKTAVADQRISENERREILEALESSQKELENIRLAAMKA